MGKKQGSVRLSYEINGKGQKTYLRATNWKVFDNKLSQENVQLTPKFDNQIEKMYGSMTTMNGASDNNALMVKALGSESRSNVINVRRDASTGAFMFNYPNNLGNGFTNDSYLYATSTRSTKVKGESSTDKVVLGSPAYMRELEEHLSDVRKKNWWVLNGEKLVFDAGITKIMNDVNNYGDTDGISDNYWTTLCEKLNLLINQYGEVPYKELHYFRNKLNRSPKTRDEMVTKINNSSDGEKWKLLEIEESIFHMFGEEGEFNLKFISADGMFEAVYNRAGTLLTESNDPVNMGTYNYSHPKKNKTGHGMFDVAPYILYGNVEGVPAASGEFENKTRFYNNPQAVAKYEEYKNKIN